jgi:hypothetical protein
MNMADMNSHRGWAQLLAEPAGPSGVHDEALQLVSRAAARADAASTDEALAGGDDAAAAVAVLRGANAVRDFFAALRPAAAAAYRKLAILPDDVVSPAAVTLLVLTSISETAGAPLGSFAFDADRTFDALALDRDLSPGDRIAAALLALSAGRPKTVRLLFPNGLGGAKATAPARMLEALAAAAQSKKASSGVADAWEAYLRDFPAALAARQTEWRHLLLAARLVLPAIDGTPVERVADAVHQRVATLASEGAP